MTLIPLAETFEVLRMRLESCDLAPHRKAQAYHMLIKGKEADKASDNVLALHCKNRLENLLPEEGVVEDDGALPSVWLKWDQQQIEWGRENMRELLRRHGASLTPLERRSYLHQAEKPHPSRKSFWSIRQGLIQRLVRARIHPRLAPVLGPGARVSEMAIPVGPYNHRYALERTLRLLEGVDSGWVRDFMRIYTEGVAAAESLSLGSLQMPLSKKETGVKATQKGKSKPVQTEIGTSLFDAPSDPPSEPTTAVGSRVDPITEGH